mmetsp:Transcript_39468/g.119254  ORF Transcript_39468/g.119254 Transcript_39468/m.119254 type:complete len:215 (+) Transcript_39468:777-1421(+)
MRTTVHPEYSAGPSTTHTFEPRWLKTSCSRCREVWLPWNSLQATAATLPSAFSVTRSTVHFRSSVQNGRVREPSTEMLWYRSMYRNCLTRRCVSASSSASRRATKSPRQQGQPSARHPATPTCCTFSTSRTFGRPAASARAVRKVASSEQSSTRTTSKLLAAIPACSSMDAMQSIRYASAFRTGTNHETNGAGADSCVGRLPVGGCAGTRTELK